MDPPFKNGKHAYDNRLWKTLDHVIFSSPSVLFRPPNGHLIGILYPVIAVVISRNDSEGKAVFPGHNIGLFAA